ncbi:MAG: prolyl oligopeptidase family serine peptidase [Bacteroidota bacterium]
MKFLSTLSFLFFIAISFAQNPDKKTLGHEELVTWNRIQSEQISKDGNWVVYHLHPEQGNKTLKIYNAQTKKTITFPRSEAAKISADSRFVVFKIKTDWEELRTLKRQKTKKDDLPKDTLGIYDLNSGKLEKIAGVKSFKLPAKWSGWLAYHKEIEKIEKDTTAKEKPKAKIKKESKKSGTKLVIRDLNSSEETIIEFVKDYVLAKEGKRVLMNSTGKDSTFTEGVYLFDCQNIALKPIFTNEGEYKNLTFDEKGEQVAFHLNLDTTKMQIPPFALAYWKDGLTQAKIIVDTTSKILAENWRVSENGRLRFSKNGQQLYFGIAPLPILQDTSVLDEDIVKVEVWSYSDAVLHTQQNNRLAREKKRTYGAVWNIAENQLVQLGSKEIPEVRFGDEGNANYALGYNDMPYFKEFSWEGVSRKDLSLINTKNGKSKIIARAIEGYTSFSPKAKFIYWYNRLDSAWFAYEVASEQLRQITNNEIVTYYSEIHDTPSHPYPYGIAGWTENDRYILVNDRYDIWKIDPKGNEKPIKLTNGRVNKTRYRYLRLDPEERNIDLSQPILLNVFDEKSKGSGYATLDAKSVLKTLVFDAEFRYDSRPKKSENADRFLFTKENFQTFPDLYLTDMNMTNPDQISNANPQQADYSWGSIELYEWTDLNGNVLTGQLVKPENFDPSKQYPMLVNFYEKSSDRLHKHRAPYPHRSTINYSFYASKGYLVFNPDVPYRIGYPGESALNAVLSGVTSLIDKGFVNREKIGVQGHSWGGYQVAYLLNRTDIFACAESGAPVVNMFSAYGGIRWGSGMSRMFQYEHTQSRIGGTIWEYPLRYLENSPIFTLDKCNTPVLILHNDKDGAVPWYQGIEYFVGLRRLNKPAWMLNYNEEPHWPLKLQNRKDFNIRMQQFFDHYLIDTPMPQWMERGVPAIEKGILQGLEMKE